MDTSPQGAPVGRWRQAAGVGAVVAVLIVAQARTAAASTASPPTATQTLSTGAYHWHVAASPIGPATQPKGGGPLHGEFPIVAVDGTVQIRRWQWGAVAALSADALTVVSDDGYISDYRVGAGVGGSSGLDPLSVGELVVGELVTVVGTVEAANNTIPE
jgi:hypothetical protein